MYEAYWQLQQKPFDNCADPKFYYPGESHQAALLKLRYAVENQRGAALLSGAPGSGKTLVASMLRSVLDEVFSPWVHLVFPQMPPEELLAYLASRLTGEIATATRVPDDLRRIERCLAENAKAGRHAVLLLDEAHLLDGVRALETLRLLLNYEFEGRPALTLILSGQPAILPVLDRIPHFEERLGVKCLLRPFSERETAEYVEHRLRVAGAPRPLFEPEALSAVYRLTLGFARRINRLCDLALLIGYAEQRRTIAAAQLEGIQHELVTVAPE